MTDPTNRPLVITHASCPDGWCCEWLFRRHFGAGADYIQAKYGDRMPHLLTTGRPHVYVADFSWPREDMLHLALSCDGRLTVIDHHATAAEPLSHLAADVAAGLPERRAVPTVVFDQNHSGAALTWQFLKNAGATADVFAGGNPPALVQLVEDRDLWRWELPYSRELNAAIGSYPKTVAAWDDLFIRLGLHTGEHVSLVAEGSALLRSQAQSVAAHVGRAVELTIDGHKVLAVNATTHHSEIGGELAAGRPFGVTFYDDLERGLRVWSFRVRDGGADVSEVAKKYGGGGHVRASGCQTPLNEPISAMA